MKPVIHINFVDEFPGFKPEDEYIFELMSRDYDVDISKAPDYIFCACFGNAHLNYDCVKILVSGENRVPDFNLYDYAIGFDPLSFGDRFLRMPLFPFYKSFRERALRAKLSDQELLDREFCSFVVSNNNGDPLREEFFHSLSKYKKVASGGRFLNNVGAPVDNKLDFCARFKFNIAFENSVAPGYTTEKIMEPLEVQSVPIYYGNPHIEEDVHPECMVQVRSRDDVARAIDEIIYLDTHDEEYLKKCHAQSYVHPLRDYYDKRLLTFLHSIFDQPKAKAKRIITHGCQAIYRQHLKDLENCYSHFVGPYKALKTIMRAFKV